MGSRPTQNRKSFKEGGTRLAVWKNFSQNHVRKAYKTESSGEPGSIGLGQWGRSRTKVNSIALRPRRTGHWFCSNLRCESPECSFRAFWTHRLFTSNNPGLLRTWPALPRGHDLQSADATLTRAIEFLLEGQPELWRAGQALRTERHCFRLKASWYILSWTCPLPKPAPIQTLCPLSESQAAGR